MKGARMKALWAILRGFLTAAAATLLGMLLLAAAVIYLEVSDGALTALNQLLKLLCVALGARFAVGVGGERGFFTGAAVGLLYMAVGYALYWQLGGALFSAGRCSWRCFWAAGSARRWARCAPTCIPARGGAAKRRKHDENTTSAQYFCKDFFPKIGNFPPFARVQGDENNASGPLAAGKNGRV